MPGNPKRLHGINLFEAIHIARRRGASVLPKKGTGELRFTHPRSRVRVVVSARRKDAPRQLTQWLMRLPRPLGDSISPLNGSSDRYAA